MTPWVGRLLAANLVVMLLASTVFTAPRFLEALAFDPATFPARPWTALTYLFAHGGVLHLALSSLALALFGPPVERKLGSRRFLAFYLYCGAGAALFAFGLSTVLEVAPLVGPTSALYGVMLAFVWCWPDAGIPIAPFRAPISARALFTILLTVDTLGALITGTLGTSGLGIPHLAHLGGACAGYLFFRVRAFAAERPAPRIPTAPARRPVVTPMRVQETVTEMSSAPAVMEAGPPEVSDDEIDRVLDKISRHGMGSLTSEERQFLADASKRKREDQI